MRIIPRSEWGARRSLTGHRWLNSRDDRWFDRLSDAPRPIRWLTDSNRFVAAWEAAFSLAHKAWCEVVGHEVENDQCGIPAHRLCYGCSQGFPNAPLGGWPRRFRIILPGRGRR